jgi:hypothetical protein
VWEVGMACWKGNEDELFCIVDQARVQKFFTFFIASEFIFMIINKYWDSFLMNSMILLSYIIPFLNSE